MMRGDLDTSCSPGPGLRAQFGRLLHGLHPYRLLQLIGTAWTYLVGLGSRGLFSFLLPDWEVHNQVGPGELPEVLEALGGCLEELGPWKELEQECWEPGIEILSSWQGFVTSGKEQGLWEPELECWKDNMAPNKEQWEPGLAAWKDLLVPNQKGGPCNWKPGTNPASTEEPHTRPQEESCPQLHFPGFSMVSYILSPGGVTTFVAPGKEQLGTDHVVGITKSEFSYEIEHIRNKRLWFLQQNQAQEAPNLVKQESQDLLHNDQYQEVAPHWDQCDQQMTADQDLLEGSDPSQLYSDFEQPNTNQGQKLDQQLLIPEQGPDCIIGTQSKYLPSPDQDQGYFSLEDWHSSNIIADITPCPETNMAPACCLQVALHDLSPVQFEKIHDSDEEESDLEEDLPITARPICTNKHISYILGAPASDDEDSSSCSEDEDWDEEDNGFDSEGSLSDTDDETEDPEATGLLNTLDPYNPQNFTAAIHTGASTEETLQVVEGPKETPSDDDCSWCDSVSESGNESEDEISVDEEENLKLWTSFTKSEDPYNPFCFKAPVQTAERKRESKSTSGKDSELTRGTVTYCERSFSCHSEDPCYPKIRGAHPPSIQKKVTFSEKITEYYVCSDEDRKGPWEEYARDRCRFQRRIHEVETAIGHCFTFIHRQRVWDSMEERWGS
ncbi:protein phosphatase 1 regulatory subunit 15B [Discoglossus pictus]